MVPPPILGCESRVGLFMILQHFNVLNCAQIGDDARIATNRLKILANPRALLGRFRQRADLHRPKGSVFEIRYLLLFTHASTSIKYQYGDFGWVKGLKADRSLGGGWLCLARSNGS